MLDPEAHEQINAALRQSLADRMPDSLGDFIAVRDLPGTFQVAPMGDLAVTYVEHRAAGLGVTDALGALAAEIHADGGRRSDPDLVGLGLIGHGPVRPIGAVASLLAVVDARVHQIVWPHTQAQPAWDIKPVTEVDDEACAAYLAGLQTLLDALIGTDDGGAR